MMKKKFSKYDRKLQKKSFNLFKTYQIDLSVKLTVVSLSQVPCLSEPNFKKSTKKEIAVPMSYTSDTVSF